MVGDPVTIVLSMIFGGAAIVATGVLYTRQSLLVAYMLLGMLLGPIFIHLGYKTPVIKEIGDVGIVFLLFLLGLHLHPQNLLQLLRKTLVTTILSSFAFGIVGFFIPLLFGYSATECTVIGSSVMFSSTITGLKLLPTRVLHHQHTGEIMISVLLLQDLLAIIVLLFLHASSHGGLAFKQVLMILLALPALLCLAFFGANFILIKLMRRFDKVKEYLFLTSIAWCLCLASIASAMGLSADIGAFIAGISLATHPVSEFIAENLKPLRDFFLILFFFSIGADFDVQVLSTICLPAILLAGFMLVLKPLVFRFLLQTAGEAPKVATEVGIRLGQMSEFSLLIAYFASDSLAKHSLISEQASSLIQAATILTFIVSSYWVILRYRTPMAITEDLRQE